MKNYFFNKAKLSIVLALLGMCLLTNCEKDEENNPNDNSIEKVDGVFVINEGAFMNENSSLSYINKITGDIHNDLFYEANNRFLGDVFQSMKMINQIAYLVINNSGVIEIVDPETTELINTISGFTSPRHILPVDQSTAYVSDLFEGKIWIVNLSENKIESEIAFPGGWSETMSKTDERVFVTAPNANKVYIIDPSTHTITDSITVYPQPNSMLTDKDGTLWVLSGGEWEGDPGGLTAINPNTLEVTVELPFAENSGSHSKLTTNNTGDRLYYIGGDIWEVIVDEPELPSTPLIKNQDEVFYGLGVSPETGNIYVSDAIDFNQKGKVIRFTSEGDKIESFDAGIVPAGFVFY